MAKGWREVSDSCWRMGNIQHKVRKKKWKDTENRENYLKDLEVKASCNLYNVGEDPKSVPMLIWDEIPLSTFPDHVLLTGHGNSQLVSDTVTLKQHLLPLVQSILKILCISRRCFQPSNQRAACWPKLSFSSKRVNWVAEKMLCGEAS